MNFKFKALNSCWAAIHPNPSGLIYFIGGAFFGSIPNLFYRYLLENIYNQSYTIVAIPYRFTFRHWNVSLSIFSSLEDINNELICEAHNYGYSQKLYEEIKIGNKCNVFWIGHSLGCKYIALLELLTEVNSIKSEILLNDSEEEIFNNCITLQDQEKIISLLESKDLCEISIKDQESILLAPAIEGIEAAVPIFRNNKFFRIRNFLASLGINVKPSQKEAFCLISQSNLFNLTNLISFKGDTRVAAPTVSWLINNLGKRIARIDILEGKHLAPLGLKNGDPRIWKTIDQILAKRFTK